MPQRNKTKDVGFGKKIQQYILLMRLNKPIGTFLLLWPTLTALWIASDGMPPRKILFIFLGGVFIMRAAGCVFNDLADRNIDGYVQRTQNRPLATGAISIKEALILGAILLTCAFFLVLMLNRLAFYIALIGVFLTICYPFFKRITYLPQLILGITFNLGILMAFALYQITPAAWILYIAAILWTVSYDTQYAMADREDDLKIGVKSSAILFGAADRVVIAILQILILLALILLGFNLDFNFLYYLGILVICLFFIYQQYLIRNRLAKKCFKAFMNNNWGLLILFITVFYQS